MIRVQEDDFDIGMEIKALTKGRTEIGGVASFIGLVRDFVEAGEGGEVTSIRAMMLEHLGHGNASDEILRAIEIMIREKIACTPDMGGNATTSECTSSILEILADKAHAA